jgi:hypothetical protein
VFFYVVVCCGFWWRIQRLNLCCSFVSVDVALLALSKVQNDPVKKDLLVMSIQSRIDELEAFCSSHDQGITNTISDSCSIDPLFACR